MAPVSVVLHQFPTPSLIYQGHAGHQHCRGLHRRPLLVHHGCTRSLHTSIPRALSWREFVLTVQLFGSGVKAMYNDMKLMKQYISQYGGLKIDKLAPTLISDGKTTLMYPRKELQFMYRSRRDVKKMLPLLVLFMIPFIGYIVPLLALLYPEKLLTQHFLSPSKQAALQVASLERKKKSFTTLVQLLKDVRAGEDSDENLHGIHRMIEQVVDKKSLDDVENIFHIPNIAPDHLEHLYEGWEIKRLLRLSAMQKRSLQEYIEYIFASDWLMHLEGGVKQLSHTDLVSACLERGLYFDLKAGEEAGAGELRKKLDWWLCMSTQHKECPSLLLAYLPLAQYSIGFNHHES